MVITSFGRVGGFLAVMEAGSGDSWALIGAWEEVWVESWVEDWLDDWLDDCLEVGVDAWVGGWAGESWGCVSCAVSRDFAASTSGSLFLLRVRSLIPLAFTTGHQRFTRAIHRRTISMGSMAGHISSTPSHQAMRHA